MSETAAMAPTGQNEPFHEPSTATSINNDTNLKDKIDENGQINSSHGAALKFASIK